MLYNPNNIAIEISPVTTRLEMEVAAQLARMIGYDPANELGTPHLGRHHRELRGLWLARSVRYLPVAAAGAAAELGLALPVATADGIPRRLTELPLWELLNIPDRASARSLGARSGPRRPAPTSRARSANHSLAAIGYQEYSRRLALDYGDPLPAGRGAGRGDGALLLGEDRPRAGHRVQPTGLRAVDTRFRMDPDALWEQRACAGPPPAADRRLRQRLRDHRGECGGPARPGDRGAQSAPSGSWESPSTSIRTPATADTQRP